MTTPEEQKKIENNEALKVHIENTEKEEISPEDFLNIANKEEQKFKQETNTELSKLNSVNIDEPAFEKIKNETGLEKEIGSLNEEVEQLIANAKQNATLINSYSVIPETVDYFLNNSSSENRDQDIKFKEAEKLLKKIQDTNEEIRETNKKLKENYLIKYISKILNNNKNIYFLYKI